MSLTNSQLEAKKVTFLNHLRQVKYMVCQTYTQCKFQHPINCIRIGYAPPQGPQQTHRSVPTNVPYLLSIKIILSLAYSKVGENGKAAVECFFEKIILKILRIKIHKQNWYQWTQNFLKFLWICNLFPIDVLRLLQGRKSTDQISNFIAIFNKYLCKNQNTKKVSPSGFDLKAQK